MGFAASGAVLEVSELGELLDGLEVASAEVGIVTGEVAQILGAGLHDFAEQELVGLFAFFGVALFSVAAALFDGVSDKGAC